VEERGGDEIADRGEIETDKRFGQTGERSSKSYGNGKAERERERKI